MIWKKYINLKSGFTFVELIVVISIISLLSVNSVFYFNDFIWKQELSYDISKLESTIKDLDADVKNQKSFDYNLNFKKNSYWYYISQNSIWNDIKQEVTFDTISWVGIINLNPSSIEIWEIKVYKWHKKIEQITKNWSENINIQINDTIHVLWTLSWSTLNKLSLSYFDVDKESETKNTFIIDILDKNMVSQNSLTIQNISWNKVYNWNLPILETPVYIIFEKNWIESTLELN
jgi:prepilin-type N-terminal cleavage/methylation domain-containing protein